MAQKVAVVTGSNKGIGFATVKGLCQKFNGVVYLTSRDDERGQAAVAKLNELGLKPAYHQLDVADRESVLKFRDHLKEKHGGLDLLINNAAVANGISLFNTYEEAKEIIDINYRSILTIHELIYPLLRVNARVLNISSDCGHLSNIRNKHWIERLSDRNLTVQDVNEFVDWFLSSVKNGTYNTEDIADGGTFAAYRVSKVAVSTITKVHQKELEPRNISVNSMHPGLVSTDMTKNVGFYSADEAARTPLYLALEAPQELKGAYIWYDREILDWYDYNADWYFKVSTLKVNYPRKEILANSN